MASNRARARARYLYEQEQANKQPDQGTPVFSQQPQVDLTQQYPQGARSTMNIDGGEGVNVNAPDLNTLARGGVGMVGGAAGTMLSGGNPLGGASGYALADLLYQKYKNGENITPTNAAKRVGEGLAYEMVPKAATALGGKVLSKLIPYNKMYSGAIGVPGNVIQKEADRIMNIGLNNNLKVSKNGIERAKSLLTDNKKQLDAIINKASEDGATIDLQKVINKAKANLASDYDSVLFSNAEKNTIAKDMDSALQEIIGEHGYTYKQAKGQPVREINVPLNKAQEIKTKTQNMVNNEYTKATKFNSPVNNASKYEIRAAMADELRKAIEEAAPVKELNNASSDIMSWLGHASGRVRHASTQPLIPTKIIAPAIIETGMKGSPQTATMLGATSVMSGSAKPLSAGALWAQKLGKLGNDTQYWKQNLPYGLLTQQAIQGQPPSDNTYKMLNDLTMSAINYGSDRRKANQINYKKK